MPTRKLLRIRKPLQELAVDLLLETYGEHRYNRSPEDYERLSALIPPLKEAHHRVNQRLKELHDSGEFRERLICDFIPDDAVPLYRPYPTSISVQTIRTGLATLGLRPPKWRKQNGVSS